MRIQLRLWAAGILPLVLALTAVMAAADDSVPTPQTDVASWQQHLRNHAFIPKAGQDNILGPYLHLAGGPADEKKGLGSDFPLFHSVTRLAGMFMGRVSPLSVGSMQFCFKLDIH